MALRLLNLQLSQEDIQGLFNYFDQDHGGLCEVREILAILKAEPTPEEARWQRIGIGKQTLTPTRDVHIKVPPYVPPYYPTTLLTVLLYRTTSLPSVTPLTYYYSPPEPPYGRRLYYISATTTNLPPLCVTNRDPNPPDPYSSPGRAAVLGPERLQ